MPGNAFIKFMNGGVPACAGESLQSTHPAEQGWLEITDWSWDIESDTNFTKGTGAAVGRATPGTFSFTHAYDKSSPLLLKNIVRGTHFPSMQLDMLKQTGDSRGKPQVYFQLLASGVFVTKVSSKGSEDGSITQDVELVFKEVNLGYFRQSNLGTLDSSKGPSPFGWNIAEMNFNVSKAVKLTMG